MIKEHLLHMALYRRSPEQDYPTCHFVVPNDMDAEDAESVCNTYTSFEEASWTEQRYCDHIEVVHFVHCERAAYFAFVWREGQIKFYYAHQYIAQIAAFCKLYDLPIVSNAAWLQQELSACGIEPQACDDLVYNQLEERALGE